MARIIWLEALFTCINISLVFVSLFQGKMKWKLFWALCAGLYLPAAVISILGYKSPFEFGAVLLCGFAGTVIPFISIGNIKAAIKVYIILFYIGFSSALLSSVLWMARALQSPESVVMVLEIFGLFLLFLVCFLMNRKIISSKMFSQLVWLPTHIKIFLIVIVWFGETLVSFISAAFLRYPRTPELITAEILMALAVIVISVLCPVVVTTATASAYFKSASENMEKQVRAQVTHYQLLTSANQDARRFRHDFINLKIGIKKLLSEGNTRSALDYLEEYEQKYFTDCVMFKSGNHVIDALLNEKNTMANDIGAAIVFDGFIPDHPAMYADLCVVFGNALDNALASLAELSSVTSKIITVKSVFENRFLCIAIQHPSADNAAKAHTAHLSAVNLSVAKHDGHLTVDNTNGVFTMKINLDLNGTADEKYAAATNLS